MSMSSAAGRRALDIPARTIMIDAEHTSIRFLLPTLTLALVVLFHLVAGSLLRRTLDTSVNPLCIVLPGDLVLLWFGGMLIERGLKRVLPSRRQAVLDRQALVVTDGRRNPPEVTRIAWDSAVNVKAWRFEVRRRGRVPRGWYCMALQLLQDEQDVILYTFMPRKKAEVLPGFAEFVRLRPRKETQSNTDLNAVAEQRRLLKLEDRRWSDGGEVTQADLEALASALAQVLPEWSAQARAR